MSITEFKNAYTEINPNANMFNLDNDAERKVSKWNFLIVYGLFFLGVFMMFDTDRNGRKEEKLGK